MRVLEEAMMKRPVRQRDGQQWIYDYILKTSGRSLHHEMDGRTVPVQAKSIRMVTKHLTHEAEHAERLARAADARGDHLTARVLYRNASEHYREAQHFTIPAICDRRWELLRKARTCVERVHSLADYPIEKVEIPFEGNAIPGLFHFSDQRKAPTVIFIPGMDNTKENFPNPLDNEFAQRGMNVLTIDGPGQGEALERGIHVTPDNHVTVAKLAFEFLAKRLEVDEARIGIMGRSFGTFWSLRAAADEPRFAAVCGAVACYFWDRLTIFDEAPIRFKQVFMAMAGMEDEDSFDEMCEGFTLKGHADRVRCPVLMATGEFDPLNPLEDAESVYEALSGPKEMWIFEDEFHPIRAPAALAGHNTFHFVADWMRRALNGEIPAGHARKAYIQKNGEGLYEGE
jgi:pimeloyl-ACP methyl ester carboxylesterase